MVSNSTNNKQSALLIVILMALLPLTLLFGILSLNPSGGGLSPECDCCTRMEVSINSSFYLTVVDNSSILDAENSSYYISSIEFAAYGVDPAYIEIAEQFDYNATAIEEYLNATCPGGCFGMFQGMEFLMGDLRLLETWGVIKDSDGSSFSSCVPQPFFPYEMAIDVAGGEDGEFFDETGYLTLVDEPGSISSFADLINASLYALTGCGEFKIVINGAKFNLDTDDFVEFYAVINGVALTIQADEFII